MDDIEHLLSLQQEFRKTATATSKAGTTLNDLLKEAGPDFMKTLNSAQQQFVKAISLIGAINEANHGPFSPEHNYSPVDKGYRFTWVDDCPDCLRLIRGAGAEGIHRSLENLEAQRSKVLVAGKEYERLRADADRQLAVLNKAANKLSIPFEVKPDGSCYINSFGTVENFRPSGRMILSEGKFIEYKVDGKPRKVIFDLSGRIIAYESESEKWKFVGLGERLIQEENERVKVKVRGGFSHDRQVPTTDILIVHRDGSGAHHHVVLDDDGNEIINEHRDGRNHLLVYYFSPAFYTDFMSVDVLYLKDLKDVVRYWKGCLSEFGDVSNREIAWSMTDVFSNDHFEEWHEADSNFAELVELVADLEHTAYYADESPMRNQQWERVEELLVVMEQNLEQHDVL